MEDICIEKETENSEKSDGEINEICYMGSSGDIYQINFQKDEKNVEIFCVNTSSNPEKKYVNKFDEYSLKKKMKAKSIPEVYELLKGVASDKTQVEEKNDKVVLTIIFVKEDENEIKVIFELSEFMHKEEKKTKTETQTETETETYNTNNINEALILIKKLKSENYELNKRLSEVERQIAIMNLNCEYNLFNVKAHNLEKIFKELKKDKNCLIKTKAELGLINKGTNYILNKSIVHIEKSYSSQLYGEQPENFKKHYDNSSIYSIIIIETKDVKRFGIFCNKEKNEEKILLNNNMMLNIPITTPYNQNMNNNRNNKNMVIGNMMNNNMNNNLMNINTNVNSLNNPMYNNQNQLNQFNTFNNIPTTDIFNSNSITNDFFFFSFDNLSLYYSNDNNNINNFPHIEIKYDNTRQSLFGTETYNNMQTNNKPKLSGKANFNILKYELYYLGLSDN